MIWPYEGGMMNHKEFWQEWGHRLTGVICLPVIYVIALIMWFIDWCSPKGGKMKEKSLRQKLAEIRAKKLKKEPSAYKQDVPFNSKGAKAGSIEIAENCRGKFFFRVVAPNGRKLCHSEGYSSKSKCQQGMRAMRIAVQNGSYRDLSIK